MINYPNKKKYIDSENTFAQIQKNNKQSHKNRGMNFESLINETNKYYLEKEIAIIYKKPTPIKVLKVENKEKNFKKETIITKAYFEEKSTTDYNGIYKNYYIDFEAKQTKYLSFNIRSNLHNHQLEHLQKIDKHGGISFILVNFQKVERTFLLSTAKIIDFLDKSLNKSLIPISYFEEEGIEIKEGLVPRINYLMAVDKLIQERL